MRKAVINATIGSLYTEPTTASPLVDEALYGMVVEILHKPSPEWYRVRTHYQYEGFIQRSHLMENEALVRRWENSIKVVARNWLDVVKDPRLGGTISLACLPKGGLLRVVKEENGWLCVETPEGKQGYALKKYVQPQQTSWLPQQETQLRKRIIETAMEYIGTPYRWGGKTTQGIDCSGLAAMAYMLNGIIIYRDSDIVDGFPMQAIPQEAIQPADLIYFQHHVGIYIGEQQFIHATSVYATEGVSISSLDKNSPRFSEKLAGKVRKVGSIFPPTRRNSLGDCGMRQIGG